MVMTAVMDPIENQPSAAPRTLATLLPPDDAAHVSLTGSDATPISKLTADSRQVTPETLFAALPGTLVDGATFIPMALEKGAAAILLGEGVEAEIPAGVAVVRSSEPRRTLSRAAAAFYGRQPDTVVAVTGTNGKTSVAAFVRELWAAMGTPSASLGTVGLVTPTRTDPAAHTTPEPVTLHAMLAGLVDEGVTHTALEASSHGLQQRRLDGVALTAAAFTNITRDHLDYHPTFEDYFAQKLRLFEELLPPGATAVIDADSPGLDQVHAVAKARGQKIITTGVAGTDIRLVETAIDGLAQHLTIECDAQMYVVRLPLVGHFQASNALVAAGLCIASGAAPGDVIPKIAGLTGARGRLEPVGQTAGGAGIFVDYAHTPDALENALAALRPYATNSLIVVFGCGGDRDPGKRPQMGQAAAKAGDIVFVTDDNPRGEDPAAIRAAALAAAPGAIEIGDRAKAIATAIHQSGEGDVILIAGKGHETGQEINGVKHPFLDHDAVAAALANEPYTP